MKTKLLLPFGAAITLALSTAFAVPAFGQSTTVIADSATPNLSSFQDLGAAPANAMMNVTVYLKLNNQAQLQQLIASHKTVTPAEFRSQFSPSNNDYHSVINQLEHAGLTVNSTSSNNMIVDVTGSVADVEAVFGTTVHQFKDSKGNTFLANTTDYHVSGALAAHLSGAAGIDQYADPRPMLANTSSSLPSGDKPTQMKTSQKSLQFFNGNNSLNIQTAYNYTPVYTKDGLDGSGQTIAVVDAYGSPTIQSDLKTFQQQVEAGAYGANDPLNLQIMAAPGSNVVAAQNPIKSGNAAGWAGEVSMDVELSHAVAPGAKILLVATPNNGSDLYMGVNKVINDHLANQMSLSFGGPEAYTPANERRAVDQMFQQAVAEGINVFVSAGDWGDFTQPPFNMPQPWVSFPASDPNVVAAGGSSLFVTNKNTYGSEFEWGETIGWTTPSGAVQAPIFEFGTGGGTSHVFPKPAWQTGVPGLSNTNMRQVPDVGYNSDPYTGFALVQGGQVQDGWGGTSDAAPQWAAIAALANEGHVKRTGSPLPYINPILYAHGQAGFHDVTHNTLTVSFVGSVSGNHYTMTMGSDTSLKATPGWDDTTGLGTPDVAAIVNELVNSN